MIKVKVQDHPIDRPIEEMNQMLQWVIDNFPEELDLSSNRWTYGRDSVDLYGRSRSGCGLLNGPWEIEYFKFRDEKDAMLFTLRWL